jgi:hypothetical protein
MSGLRSRGRRDGIASDWTNGLQIYVNDGTAWVR